MGRRSQLQCLQMGETVSRQQQSVCDQAQARHKGQHARLPTPIFKRKKAAAGKSKQAEGLCADSLGLQSERVDAAGDRIAAVTAPANWAQPADMAQPADTTQPFDMVTRDTTRGGLHTDQVSLCGSTTCISCTGYKQPSWSYEVCLTNMTSLCDSLNYVDDFGRVWCSHAAGLTLCNTACRTLRARSRASSRASSRGSTNLCPGLRAASKWRLPLKLLAPPK